MVHTIACAQVFHNHVLNTDQPPKDCTNQKIVGNQEERSVTLSGLQPSQMEQTRLIHVGDKNTTNTAQSSPDNKSLPLQTTPELYTILTEVFVDKPLVYNPKQVMVFDPPTSPEYTPHIQALKACGRRINTTIADSNCLFRSLSKGLLALFMKMPRSSCPTFNRSTCVQLKSGSTAYPWTLLAFGAQKSSCLLLLPCCKHLCTHTHRWEAQNLINGHGFTH